MNSTELLLKFRMSYKICRNVKSLAFIIPGTVLPGDVRMYKLSIYFFWEMRKLHNLKYIWQLSKPCFVQVTCSHNDHKMQNKYCMLLAGCSLDSRSFITLSSAEVTWHRRHFTITKKANTNFNIDQKRNVGGVINVIKCEVSSVDVF